MRRKKTRLPALLLLAVLLLAAASAAGESLTLPEGTMVLAAEAFAGDASLEEASLPGGLLSVGDRAFLDCGELDIVTLAGADTAIGEDAFAGCGPALLLRAPYGSAAHRYAEAHSLDYQAGTRYRALIIAQDYPGSEKPLKGPPFDAANMRSCLTGLPGTPWQVTSRANLTGEGITGAIAAAFGEAADADVSLVYYSGHGVYQPGLGSCLMGVDNALVSAGDLKAALDRVPGRKLVIVDACYSGGLLADHSLQTNSLQTNSLQTNSLQSDSLQARDNGDTAAPVGSFVSGMIAPFGLRIRGALTGSQYFVMAACAENEESYELPWGEESHGVFTSQLLTGIGFRVPGGSWQAASAADTNGDRAVSFAEAFAYARRETRRIIAEYNADQNAVCWPEDCTWFAPFRFR